MAAAVCERQLDALSTAGRVRGSTLGTASSWSLVGECPSPADGCLDLAGCSAPGRGGPDLATGTLSWDLDSSFPQSLLAGLPPGCRSNQIRQQLEGLPILETNVPDSVPKLPVVPEPVALRCTGDWHIPSSTRGIVVSDDDARRALSEDIRLPDQDESLLPDEDSASSVVGEDSIGSSDSPEHIKGDGSASRGDATNPIARKSSDQTNLPGGAGRSGRKNGRGHGKCREDEDEGDDDDDDRSDNPNAGEKNDTKKKWLACPYYKRNPTECREMTKTHKSWLSCCGAGWPDIRRLKEHLHKTHRRPWHCTNCYEIFKTKELKDAHVQRATCEKAEAKEFEGFDSEQERTVRKRPRTSSTQDRWAELYVCLFPNQKNRVPSPYSDDACGNCAHCRQHGNMRGGVPEAPPGISFVLPERHNNVDLGLGEQSLTPDRQLVPQASYNRPTFSRDPGSTALTLQNAQWSYGQSSLSGARNSNQQPGQAGHWGPPQRSQFLPLLEGETGAANAPGGAHYWDEGVFVHPDWLKSESIFDQSNGGSNWGDMAGEFDHLGQPVSGTGLTADEASVEEDWYTGSDKMTSNPDESG